MCICLILDEPEHQIAFLKNPGHNPTAVIAVQGLLVACSTRTSLETVLLKKPNIVTPVLFLRYFIVGKYLREPVNEFRGDNCFCPID